ncbi:glutathione S-transferase family protein [Parasphingopyxis sp.]|uniref:glutathione S-transferase family protein n=1 Tax=Parasphingopyxis sp. TaxID=1920299 RepID=UPI00263579CB|nr:glutathione S-transferase family protein [Parasphingopyxis sp.]
MPEIILHHYDNSPFGQIIRLCLAHKRLAWKSVEAPVVVPKPDLSVLTGGYERIPVLQIGADIYCDTAIITAALEDHMPEPSLYPAPFGVAAKMIALWSANSWFMPAVGVALGTNPDALPDAFWEDRGRRFGMQRETFLPMVPHLQSQFRGGAQLVKDALADGRAFIGGDHPGHADFALYVNMKFVEFAGVQPGDFGSNVANWLDRVAALGDGNREAWSAEQAIEHAGESDPVGGWSVAEDSGFSAGQMVSVTTESPDPAAPEGALEGLDDSRIVLSREHERTGEVHVHFPRLGQIVKPV